MAIKPGKYDSQKPDVELFDFKSKHRYGLKLEGNGLQIGTISQDDSVLIRNAGKRVGDFDEQRSWKAGRGIENLSDNAAGYWDAKDAWTLSDGHVHQTLLWKFAKGLRSADFSMPDNTHSLTWKQLLGTSLYVSIGWSSSGFTADYARMWIRRIGTPGTLVFRLHSDTAGSPGTVLQTVNKTVSDITDYVSVLQLFDWTGTQALTAATTYHITIHGASTDNNNNHWEVGGYLGGSTGKQSSNDSSYTTNGFDAFYYVADADIARKWFSFQLDGAMYIVDSKDDLTTASKLYINGDRGKATSGAASTLTQSTKSWTTNRWTGGRVKIVRGTGLGQTREIASNTSTALTVTSNWTVNPDTTSEYIIYATDWWTEITGTGLGVVTGTPAVVNQLVYIPQGTTFMRRMLWNATTVAHSFGAELTAGDFITPMPFGGSTYLALAQAVNSAVYFAKSTTYSTSPTQLAFNTSVVVGSITHPITGVMAKETLLYVFKENAVYNTDPNLILVNINSGIDKIPSVYNGTASIAHQQFVYYSWLHSLIRVYGSSHDDVGQDWSGKGLPNSREGYVSSMDAYTSLLICGINAGTGTSSVLGFDGIGWHELIRAYDANKPVRLVKIQNCQDTRNRTWVDMGGDLVYQEMPYLKGTPRLDTGVRYQHEAVVESASIDMGTASGLPKFVKELTVFCDNLGGSNDIAVDYQTDENVGTTNWTPATVLYESPESTAFLGLNNIRKFAYRLRIHSSDNTAPVDVRGVTPNGYARAPYKMVWTLRCRADNISSRGRLVKPATLMRWLLDNARFPGRIMMLSQYELAHKFFVIIHPPRMFPFKPAAAGQAEESVFTIVLEEI